MSPVFAISSFAEKKFVMGLSPSFAGMCERCEHFNYFYNKLNVLGGTVF